MSEACPCPVLRYSRDQLLLFRFNGQRRDERYLAAIAQHDLLHLGVYFVSGRFLKCNWDHAKSSYYRSFNAIFERFASVETVMYLIKSKCIPVVIYGIEACPNHSSEIKTLDHPIIATSMKVK